MRKSTVKTTLTLVMGVVTILALFQPVAASQQDVDRTTTRTADTAATTTSTASGATTSTGSSGRNFIASKKYPYSGLQSKIKEYAATNKDVKGWLIVPGTNINEPVLHSAQNNSVYMYRDWKGTNYPNTTYKQFTHTAAYTDFRTVYSETWGKSSRNTVIYGHNWTNLRNPLDIGSGNNHIMFGQLPSYTDINFAKQNPYIYYSTGNLEGVWKVFSVNYSELKASFNYNQPNPSKEDYEKLLQEWKARSMFDFGVDLSTSDRILCLSTCTRVYNAGANQRFIVVARLLRDGESENDPVNITVNQNMKQPQF